MSPTQGSLHDRFRPDAPHSIRQPKVLRPVERDELRLLLLENISMGAVKAFRDQGFQVEHHTKSWSEDELVEKIGNYHAIGIRSTVCSKLVDFNWKIIHYHNQSP